MRILGIDLGSQSVKAVEVDSAFGRYEIHDYHEITRVPGQPPAEALAKLSQALGKRPDKVVVALRTSQVTFRNLSLPTRDKKAIQAGVGFELEDELPFSLDDSAYDYSILAQTKQSTYLHVAATLKRHIGGFLAPWGAAVNGIDPDLVTTEAWAYRALMNRVLGETGPEAKGNKGSKDPKDAKDPRAALPVLLVQIGHERTTLYLHWRGTPVMARELPWGGRDLTTAICQKYQIPVDQAEAAKLDHGFVVPAAQKADATPEQLEFSDTLLGPLETLVNALKQVELSGKNLTHLSTSMIYLSGGTSLLPGLAKVLEERLQTPVRGLQALSSIASSGVTYSEQTDGTYLLAASLALCLVGPDRNATINFRRGEFAKRGTQRNFNLQQLYQPLIALAAIVVCFFASLFVQSHVYQNRIEEVDAQLEKSVRTFFGSVSTSAVHTYMSNTSTLKTSVKRELDKQRELAKFTGPNPHSPTDFLKDLSQNVPRDVVVDMTQYQVGAAPDKAYSQTEGGQASLTFLVSNPAVAERLSSILGGKLGSLQRGKMEEAPGGDGTKRWKITFTGKPIPEAFGEAYGK